jgi:hypothetical protein
MSSQQEIDANRANAHKSTGSKTAAGKAVCRTSAYRHGMRTRTVVMPGESATRQDLFQIKQMASARWRLELSTALKLPSWISPLSIPPGSLKQLNAREQQPHENLVAPALAVL